MARYIDELDEQIIGQLQIDGRRSAAEIARKFGIPRATVRRRIGSLTSEGLITIRAYANSEEIGLPIHVWFVLRVSLDRVVSAARTFQASRNFAGWVLSRVGVTS